MVCEVRRMRGGGTRVELHSTQRVVNRTSRPVVLALECPFEFGPRVVGCVKPGEGCWLPVLQPLGTNIVLQPAGVWWLGGVGRGEVWCGDVDGIRVCGQFTAHTFCMHD